MRLTAMPSCEGMSWNLRLVACIEQNSFLIWTRLMVDDASHSSAIRRIERGRWAVSGGHAHGLRAVCGGWRHFCRRSFTAL